MRALLDVNVLIALLDGGHIHHASTMAWLEQEIPQGWASCPITQNGCIRIMSQPAYPSALPTAQVAERLAEAAASPDHQFWPADINLLESGLFDWSRVLGHRQVTDIYLLSLAVRHGGRLVTFDRRISLASVASARPEQLVVLGEQL
jgi:toxin-antitoxin system PIN domain toxin